VETVIHHRREFVLYSLLNMLILWLKFRVLVFLEYMHSAILE